MTFVTPHSLEKYVESDDLECLINAIDEKIYKYR